MALKKLCSHTGCSKVLAYDEMYCQYHQKLYELSQKERYKEYNKKRRSDKEKKKYDDFYNTSEWARMREAVIAQCYAIDIVEYYRTGRVIPGERVHHIIELKDDWRYRLDVYNLIYITEENHQRIHAEYNKGSINKKRMQEILFGICRRFENEYT